jgi:gluconolactonase
MEVSGMDFVTDLGYPEGPVLLPDGGWLVVEMSLDRGWVAQISADGRRKRVLARTGRPNGLAADRSGTVWIAESLEPRLLRLQLPAGGDLSGGEVPVEEVAAGAPGEPFLFPNDLAFGPDGYLYMTDSGIRWTDLNRADRNSPEFRATRMDGRVYRIDPATGEVVKLDSGIQFTNGIAFDSAGALYVSETVTGMVYRYRLGGTGPLEREDFGNVNDPALPPGWRGPDGMKFGLDGRLYVAVHNQGDVTVLGTDGAVVERLKLAGQRPTNVAFGPAGSRRLYVTEVERGALEALDVATDGLPLHS